MKLRVLVLDDDVLMCQLLERTLGRRGIDVVCETLPLAALERLAAEEFDLVLSDLHMPGLDGLAFTQRVIGLARDLPVILITGASDSQTAIRAVLEGAWDFLVKPIDPRLLVASIERASEHGALKRRLRNFQALVGASQSAPRAPGPDDRRQIIEAGNPCSAVEVE